MDASYPEMLDKLRTLREAVDPKDRSWYTSFVFFQAKETAESLAEVEQRTGMPVPPDLKALLLDVGGFCFPMHVAGFALTFHTHAPYPRPFGGLADLLHARWVWKETLDPENFPEEAIERLNANFVCFALCDQDDDSADHYFYDRNGNFGVLYYDQNYGNRKAVDYLYDLCDGVNSRPPMTLEEVLTKPLRDCLYVEENDENDDSA